MLRDLLHEEDRHEDGSIVLFLCRECNNVYLSLESCHGHIEAHRGFTRFNIQPPIGPKAPGQFGALMEKTDVVLVTEMEKVDLKTVEGLGVFLS